MACISCGPACDCGLILKHFLFPSVRFTLISSLSSALGKEGDEFRFNILRDSVHARRARIPRPAELFISFIVLRIEVLLVWSRRERPLCTSSTQSGPKMGSSATAGAKNLRKQDVDLI